jgi:hypothetical protein
MATFEALQTLKTPAQMAAMRGKDVEDVMPFWEQAALRAERASVERVKEKQQAERAERESKSAGEIAAESAEGE